MRFLIKLFALNYPAVLPLNYQYPLSAVIYKILRRADQEYASFLHETGYRAANSLKSFKLFTFSDIKTPFKIKKIVYGQELEINFLKPNKNETLY